jgi:hypothetical protein
VPIQKELQRAKVHKTYIGIATTCTPKKYPSFDTPDGTVARMMVRYMQNLQQNDCVARPQNWSQIIHLPSSRREQPPSQHPNFCIRSEGRSLNSISSMHRYLRGIRSLLMVSEEKDSLPSAEPSISLSRSPSEDQASVESKQHTAKEISAKKGQPAINSEPNHALF